MAYIDYGYYRDEYKGEEIPKEKFEKYVREASEVVDQFTHYTLKNVDFERLAPFIRDQVRKATAAQVEFYQLSGGTDIAITGDDITGVTLGKFSYGGGRNANGENNKPVADNLMEYLRPTGLLYSGIGVVHSAY